MPCRPKRDNILITEINILILVINLPHRLDRLEFIKKELLDYDYIIIEAIKTNKN